MKKFCVFLVVLVLSVPCHADIVEGFDPGGGLYVDISQSPRTSADTGYTWSGYYMPEVTSWGMAMWDSKSVPTADGVLDISGNGLPAGYDNINAWTIFNGDYADQLKSISFEWALDGGSGNFLAKALIQDADYNWFVSDDSVVDTLGTTQTLDATTTTWKVLNSDPVINTALDIGGAGVPDLSKVYGGGFLTVGTGTPGPQTRLNTLTFAGISVKSRNPDPKNTQTNVVVSKVLGWDAPRDYTPSGYDIYMDIDQVKVTSGSGACEYVSLNQPGNSFSAILSPNTKYYWRIDAIDGGTKHPGDVWEFTTRQNPSCLAGDLYFDCKVDLCDLVMFAAEWLGPAGVASDLTGNNGVDIDDLGVIAMNWLQEGELPVVINEIYYNPDGKVKLLEFIELHNPMLGDVDVSGWHFCDGINYQFPQGTILPAGGYIVVTEDASLAYTPITLTDEYGTPANLVYGPFEGGLDNEGEKIELCNAQGVEIDQVDYKLGFPWPTTGDMVSNSSGHSIQLTSPIFDNDLGGSWRSEYPTPGADNVEIFAENIPPHIRQVQHSPQQPVSSDVVTITAKVTDPDGVSAVTLHYQLVDPGSYIPIKFSNLTDNPAYEDAANWTDLMMNDGGTGGDLYAGDDIYTVQMPAVFQTHRRLIRYRITVEDATAKSITVPYVDDGQPNFAYFVYDGVPAWTGADRPGVTSDVTYDTNVMRSLPVYHLIADESDIMDALYNWNMHDKTYRFAGTLVYDGQVYDHIHFRIKGQFDPRVAGKNRLKFRFNRGHYFQTRDDYGNKYPRKWELMNLSACINPWNYQWVRGTSGMDEAAAFRLYEMVGVPSSSTNWFQLRIIDDAVETHPTDQYSGDFWGVYLTIENPGARFLDRNETADGNIYKMGWTNGPSKTNQGTTQVTG
ncbi:MAG: lamin tail domain-containing protein, partial [Planctomycetota bacterium]